METKFSQKLFEESQELFPGGVNSPVRAFGYVGGSPRFVSRAKGAHFWDADGNKYIDYVGSWGPAILGHAHDKVVAAVKEAAENGFSFGAPTEMESRLAKMIQVAFPQMEKMRFVSSGTEATMSAIRVARGATKRNKIIKFEGCYHGHADSLLVQAGSGAATFGVPSSGGVPAELAALTLVATFNDLNSVENLLKNNRDQVACILVEPVAGNMGCIPPSAEFLPGLRTLCDQHGALLIFDEVMTGFRLSFGGATQLYNVHPDLICLGKIIGGGLPCGVYGGAAQYMDQVSPLGPIYQAGTLSGNPLAMAAGIATLSELAQKGFYEKLGQISQTLTQNIKKACEKHQIQHQMNAIGSMWTFFFNPEPVIDWPSVKRSNTELFKKLFHFALERGVYLPPSPFEAAFISIAHSDEDIKQTVDIFEEFFKSPSCPK